MKQIYHLCKYFLFKAFRQCQVVALIKLYDNTGMLIQLEREGRYAHTAILINGRWMHAGPRNGVEFISTLDDMKLDGMYGPRGFDVDIFFNFNQDSPSKEFINKFIGNPYDPEFNWKDGETYCSELIAKALGIPPEPMEFDDVLWGGDYTSRRDELGISPDDLIKPLLNLGYRKFSCPRKIQQKLI
jgi:hypothetical protein